MNYNIAICDDERDQLEKLQAVAAEWAAENGYSCRIRTFASAEEFLFEYEDDKA